jgi:hypothetical protein
MSSFLGRASQFYAMPLKELIGQLLGGEKVFGKGISDLDLNPSPQLEKALAESVEGWISPLADFHGLHGPIVIYRGRHAYCPRCFKDDLEAGRVPYFRMDWGGFFVSTCWIHGSLLLPWHATNGQGLRRLPKTWLYGLKTAREEVPDFFEAHLRLLENFERGATRIYGGLDPRTVAERLARLQSVVEKQSTEPAPTYPKGKDPRLRLRRIAYEVATVAAGPLWGVGPYGRNVHWLTIEPESYELVEVPSEPQVWERSMHALRRAVDLNWRRTFLWVVAMSLGGTQEFGALLSSDGAHHSWRRWWIDCLVPMVGEVYRERFEGAMDRLSNHLDGMGRHGTGAPSLIEMCKHKSSLRFARKSNG